MKDSRMKSIQKDKDAPCVGSYKNIESQDKT